MFSVYFFSFGYLQDPISSLLIQLWKVKKIEEHDYIVQIFLIAPEEPYYFNVSDQLFMECLLGINPALETGQSAVNTLFANIYFHLVKKIGRTLLTWQVKLT